MVVEGERDRDTAVHHRQAGSRCCSTSSPSSSTLSVVTDGGVAVVLVPVPQVGIGEKVTGQEDISVFPSWHGRGPIALNPGESVVLGRGQNTNIQDLRCSRRVAQLTNRTHGDTSSSSTAGVFLKKISHHQMAVKGELVADGQFVEEVFVAVGEDFGLLANLYRYRVQLAEAPSTPDATESKSEIGEVVPEMNKASNGSADQPRKRPKVVEVPQMVSSAELRPSRSTPQPQQQQQQEQQQQPAQEAVAPMQRPLKISAFFMPRKQVQQSRTSSSALTSSQGQESKAAPVVTNGARALSQRFRGVLLPPSWHCISNSLLTYSFNQPKPSSKIAAFDFDGCLAATSLGGFDPKAWSLRFPTIPAQLEQLHATGYKIVIITNESSDRYKKPEALQKVVAKKTGRLLGFLKAVNVPTQVFCAMRKDAYRKPSTGAWQALKDDWNDGMDIDISTSFYVGDAAGRRTDHSDSDKAFAQALGLPFFNETQFFLSNERVPSMDASE